MDPRRVLVIEDDPSVTELLKTVLIGDGYVVMSTEAALGALALARRLKPDVILLDLGLPYRSGASLLADLKADPRTEPIPVIVVSSMTELLTPDRRALAADVIAKPFDVQMLLERVRVAVQGGRAA